jgi:hypothetical protein
MTAQTRHYPVHIGTVTHQYENSPVQASQILADFGFTPPELYILERLEGDRAVAEYGSQDAVPLDSPDKNRFRAVPSGGGRA